MDRNDIHELSKKILALHEEERRRISRDLHDETGQLSVSLGAALNIIEKDIEKKNLDKALLVIKDAKSILAETTKRIKTLVLDLRPAELDIVGLAAVLRELFSHYTKSYPLDINFKENTANIIIKRQIAITLYRIIQEALNNIVKHAKAKHVKIDLLIEKDEIRITIEDDGIGFDVESVLNDTSLERLGMRGMKERVDILNGNFSINSQPKKGCKVVAIFPMEEE